MRAAANAQGMSDKLLTFEQLIRTTNLPAAWVKREADAGRLPCIRIGRRRMFDLDAVRRALAERSARPEGGQVR
jgi:hypothetical protein